MKRTPWWQTSCVYQIYPRSFCDANGDGIGDLPGITSKLDHLRDLGVDVVWLSPVYASPNDDNGYDISDYCAIHPDFGTLADFDAMLAAMQARGLRLVMDLVVNHTSDEHAWFQAARRSRDDPHHDWYLWAEPAPGGGPPNDWRSVFGGSAWEWNEATGEYFLHLFSRRQPDLNWEHPAVRAEVHALMRFWLDKGVAGFRMDVIDLIAKPRDAQGRVAQVFVPGPRLAEHLLEMRREVLDRHDTLTVGEAPSADPALARLLTDADTGALDMLFQFEHVSLDQHATKWDLKPLDLRAFKRSLFRWQAALAERGWNSLYLGNHDQPRAASRFGDGSAAAAKCLALLNHAPRGTPYVYQGDEIGMTNFPFTSVDQCRDIETLNFWREALEQRGWTPEQAMQSIRAKGRDNARTPMQWSAAPGAGFTRGTPWLAVNPNHEVLNVEAQAADPGSVLHFHRRLIALRKQRPALATGRFAPLLEEHPQLFACTRSEGAERLLVVCNVSAESVAWPGGLDSAGELLLSVHGDRPGATLRPWEGVLLQLA